MKDDELVEHGRLIVVAIDFGTTYSGYAYCKHSDYRKNPANPTIHCNQWNEGTRLTHKAPTCVLFTPDKKFHSFGYDAIKTYHENPEKLNLRDWYYFEHFKMLLYKEQHLTTETYLEESLEIDNQEMRKKMKAVDVFAAVIAHFKQILMGDIKKSESWFKDKDIQWVITVPAIWDLAAKQFMREAAKRAGIPHDQLMLALEPEAASLHCRRVPVGVETEGDGRKIIATMHPGSKFIVLDQGGGTTDIAVHEVTGLKTLKEIHPACGGHWGGITVNAQFKVFLEEIFGEDVIEVLKEKNPSSYFELLHTFEHTKTSFKREDENEGTEGQTTIRMPVLWTETYEKVKSEKLSKKIPKTNFDGRVIIKGDKMRIKNNLFRTFYDYSIEHVTEELEKLLEEKEMFDVKTLLIVGGHSESTVLTEAIKDRFKNIGIVVPKEPGSAVLKGAVLFGFEPETITSRVARYTYGIATTREFKKGVDPESKKITVDGSEKCKDVFDKHIEIRQTLDVGENKFLPEHSYLPLYKDQKSVDFKFYQTVEKNPKYVTDAGCECIGSLHFKLTESTPGKQSMALKINASFTELVAVVTETATKKEVKGYFRLPK